MIKINAIVTTVAIIISMIQSFLSHVDKCATCGNVNINNLVHQLATTFKSNENATGV